MIRTFLIVDDRAAEYRDMLAPRFPDVEFWTATSARHAEDVIAGADASAAFGYFLSDALLDRAERLQWLQLLSSGVDKVIGRPQLAGKLLTSAAGIHGPMVSEMAFALMLSLARNLPEAVSDQARAAGRRAWGTTLAGKTIGILGMGVIGAALARRAKAFEMTVVGFGSALRDVADVDRFALYDELPSLCADLDYVVLVAPLRKGAPPLVGAPEIAAMKRTAIILNVGRGATLDEGAVVAALNEGRLAGAALDALSVEPLPSDHPLWSATKLLITPHIGGRVEEYPRLAAEIVATNLRAMQAGRPADMVNLIDH